MIAVKTVCTIPVKSGPTHYLTPFVVCCIYIFVLFTSVLTFMKCPFQFNNFDPVQLNLRPPLVPGHFKSSPTLLTLFDLLGHSNLIQFHIFINQKLEQRPKHHSELQENEDGWFRHCQHRK